MGGRGSGRTGGYPTAEACGSFVLDVRSFAAVLKLPGERFPATFTFDEGGSDELTIAMDVDTTNEHLPLVWFEHERRTASAEIERYRIAFESTRPNFGGRRWYFRCPCNGSRVTRLFLPLGGHGFWSRKAYRLGFACQRESWGDRADRQARKLHRKLGGDGQWRSGSPDKPKGMRWHTYERHMERLGALEERVDAAWLGGALRFLARHRR